MKKILFFLAFLVNLNSNDNQIYNFILDRLKNNKNIQTKDFGGWSIDKEVLYEILTLVKPGEKILELGSGLGSIEILKYFNLYSIEHDENWLNKFHQNYIYAPIKNNWYDIDILKKQLPNEYSLILVDGPTGNIGRIGFYHNLNLFNTNVPIIIDDVNREAELNLLKKVSKHLNKNYYIKRTSGRKMYGVIL